MNTPGTMFPNSCVREVQLPQQDFWPLMASRFGHLGVIASLFEVIKIGKHPIRIVEIPISDCKPTLSRAIEGERRRVWPGALFCQENFLWVRSASPKPSPFACRKHQKESGLCSAGRVPGFQLFQLKEELRLLSSAAHLAHRNLRNRRVMICQMIAGICLAQLLKNQANLIAFNNVPARAVVSCLRILFVKPTRSGQYQQRHEVTPRPILNCPGLQNLVVPSSSR